MSDTAGRFPIALFPPAKWRWMIAGAPLVGGQPIAGPPQSADNSTGGWWVCEWSPGIVSTRQQHGALRAILGQLNTGVRTIEVPVLDSLQPWPTGFPGDPIEASLAADAYMPAYPAPPTSPRRAHISIVVGAALQGGEYFTVIGPSGQPRLHMVCGIDSVVDGVSSVWVNPPFREDMPAGTAVDFNTPRCLMKLDVASAKDAWPELTAAMIAHPTLKFVEGGFVVPDD